MSLIKLYWVSSTNVCNSPCSTRAISIKFWSLVSSIDFFIKLTLIWRRSAPGAAKFVNPDALSFNESSSSALMKFSWTSNPIRYVGVLLYWSKTKVSPWTWANVPRIKYTPSPIDIADPIAVAPNARVFANGSFAAITLAPYTISLFADKLSPSLNVSVVKSSPDFSYLI